MTASISLCACSSNIHVYIHIQSLRPSVHTHRPCNGVTGASTSSLPGRPGHVLMAFWVFSLAWSCAFLCVSDVSLILQCTLFHVVHVRPPLLCVPIAQHVDLTLRCAVLISSARLPLSSHCGAPCCTSVTVALVDWASLTLVVLPFGYSMRASTWRYPLGFLMPT